jgi:hypothetical protein
MTIEKQYDLREAAHALRLGVDALRHAVWEHKIAYTRLGGTPRGRIRIAESDLQAFLQRHRVSALGEEDDLFSKKSISSSCEKRPLSPEASGHYQPAPTQQCEQYEPLT